MCTPSEKFGAQSSAPSAARTSPMTIARSAQPKLVAWHEKKDGLEQDVEVRAHRARRRLRA